LPFGSRKGTSRINKLLPVPSYQQLADIFTKALPPRLFHANMSKLEIVDTPLQLAGG